MTYEDFCKYWHKYPYTTYITINDNLSPVHIFENPQSLKIKSKLKGCSINLDITAKAFNALRNVTTGNFYLVLHNSKFFLLSEKQYNYHAPRLRFSKRKVDSEIKKIYFI